MPHLPDRARSTLLQPIRGGRRRILCSLWSIASLLLMCLPGRFVLATDAEWRTVGVPQGLLSATVHALSPTNAGGMLVGTSGGLNHWDGQRWISYSAGNGLAQGYITAVVEHGGQLWAGSWGGGLCVLQGEAWQCYRAENSPLPGDWIGALASDGDRLWIATYGRGLALWEAGRWSLFNRESGKLSSDWLTCLAPDSRGGVWVGAERAGLVHIDAQTQTRRYSLTLETLENDQVTALALQGEALWVGTHRGVGILDVPSNTWRWLRAHDGLPSERVTALSPAHDGGMWIGTDKGLTLYRERILQTVTVRDGLAHNLVSAVAVDADGRVWAGSYTRGLAVSQPLAPREIARLPVILVHGWRGPDSDLLEDSEFWHLARWLREDGFRPYYATGISPQNTLHANALRLREVIAQARRETGAEKVYIIAFSMGGLNTRAYLESSLYQGDVQRAFILGTPHRGEHLWLPLLLWEHLSWSVNEPSALELLPLHAELFNRTHRNSGDVPYTLVAGDARAERLPTLFRELPPSDGLVSAWSALGVSGPQVEQRVSKDIHAWGNDTILLELPSLLFPRTTYDAFIRPHLFGAADAPGAGSARPILPYTRPLLEPRSDFRAGVIAPGQTITLTAVPLDAGGRSRFYLRWKGPAPEFSLRDPQGRLYEADSIEEDKIEYLSLDFTDFASYVVTDTLPGDWHIVLSADAQHSAPSEFVAYATLDSPLRLTVSANCAWCRPGQVLEIVAEIEDEQRLATVDDVVVQVHAPDRQPQIIPLAPRSAGEANERLLWEGRYTIPEQGGYYAFLARATGKRGELTFERGEALLVGVSSETAKLDGNYQLTAGARDAHNEITDLSAWVDVSVRVEGHYLLSVILADEAGREVAQVAHPVQLSAGRQTVCVDIPGRAVRASRRDGPYVLQEVLLLNISGAGLLLDSVQHAARSAAWRYTDFAQR